MLWRILISLWATAEYFPNSLNWERIGEQGLVISSNVIIPCKRRHADSVGEWIGNCFPIRSVQHVFCSARSVTRTVDVRGEYWLGQDTLLFAQNELQKHKYFFSSMQETIPDFNVCVCLQYDALLRTKWTSYNCMSENLCDISACANKQSMIYMWCSMKLANVSETSRWWGFWMNKQAEIQYGCSVKYLLISAVIFNMKGQPQMLLSKELPVFIH